MQRSLNSNHEKAPDPNYVIDWESDKIWWRLCDFNASKPIPLNEADITKPFIYCRRYGLFYVGFGNHQLFMSWLYSVDQVGLDAAGDYQYDGDYDFYDLADKFLVEYDGACMQSSVGINSGLRTILCDRIDNMNPTELKIFGSNLEVI